MGNMPVRPRDRRRPRALRRWLPPSAAGGRVAAWRALTEGTGRSVGRYLAQVRHRRRTQSSFAAWLSGLAADDLKDRALPLPSGGTVRLVYLSTLADEARLWREAVEPLLAGRLQPATLPGAMPARIGRPLAHRLLRGDAALVDLGSGEVFTLAVGDRPGRPVGEPSTETVTLGPKAGMVEKLDINIGLIRGVLRDPQLRVETLVVGRRSRTRVALLYLADVANLRMVGRARRGLKAMALDYVRSAADVAATLYHHSWSLFPLADETERADKVARAVAAGRLALVVDGSPFAVLVPAPVGVFLQDSEQTMLGPALVAFSHVLRIIGLLVATGAAGFYVAITTNSVDVLPVRLVIAVTASRAGVPYPPLTEALISLLVADVLVEATVQASKSVGNALTIVGTLIIGQMIVSSRLASNLMMMVVAVTVLGSFLALNPVMSYGLRMWKYVQVWFAAVAGLDGWMAGWILMVAYLSTLKTAGVPYLSPFGPLRLHDLVNQYLAPHPPEAARLRPAMWRPRDRARARPGAQR
jgi:hypothetical protein